MVEADIRASDERMMRRCFALAIKSSEQGEYPYGAVIARNGEVVVESTNRVARDRDVTRHAEVVAISEAQKAIGSTSLDGCTMYVNAEPCALCCYAIRESRIGRVVFGMRSPLMGGMSRWNILGDCRLSDAMPEVFAPRHTSCRISCARKRTQRSDGRPQSPGPSSAGVAFSARRRRRLATTGPMALPSRAPGTQVASSARRSR